MRFVGDFNMDWFEALAFRHARTGLAPGELRVQRAQGNNVAKHSHQFLELGYVYNGAISHCIYGDGEHHGDTVRTVHAGEYFIVDWGTAHSYQVLPGEPLRMVNIMFYPEFIDRSLVKEYTFHQLANSYLLQFNCQTLRSSPTGFSLSDANQRIGNLVAHIAEEYVRNEDGYLEYIRGLLIQVLVITLRRIGRREQSTPLTNTVSEVLQIIQTRYNEKLSLTEIAREQNYSLPSLSRKFRQETGITFSAYLQKVRIDRSCQLLLSSTLTVGEISQLVGYEDVRFFNSRFKQAIGFTPRQFRRMHRY